jgi:hypothetical protein
MAMTKVRLSKMSLNETYSKVCIGKYFPDGSAAQNYLKKGYDLLLLFVDFSLECVVGKVQGNAGGIRKGHVSI